jgi:hypothetical protein
MSATTYDRPANSRGTSGKPERGGPDQVRGQAAIRFRNVATSFGRSP